MEASRTGSETGAEASVPADHNDAAGHANGAAGAAALLQSSARPMHQDIEPHVEAWENFVALTKWSTIGIAAILVALAVFLL